METITSVTVDDSLKDFYWRTNKNTKALVCLPLERIGFTNGFSTRLGGTSPMPEAALNLAGFVDDAAENIHENRRRFLELFNSEWNIATVHQTHSADVRSVCDAELLTSTAEHLADWNDSEHCDALTTRATGVLVAVKHADCVPVLLGDAHTGACAAVHAGWRGTVELIVPRTLRHMQAAYGTQAQDVVAAVGPAALKCCYEVGAEVIDAFHESFQYADALFTATRPNHAHIDLHAANRRQLIAAGVDERNIYAASFCTMHNNDLFFSYRQEKHLHGRVGRLLSVIGRVASC